MGLCGSFCAFGSTESGFDQITRKSGRATNQHVELQKEQANAWGIACGRAGLAQSCFLGSLYIPVGLVARMLCRVLEITEKTILARRSLHSLHAFPWGSKFINDPYFGPIFRNLGTGSVGFSSCFR